MGAIKVAALAVCLLLLPTGASAKWVVKDGFAFQGRDRASVVVLRPDVKVGSMSTGGIDEPNSDWTAEARKLITQALGSSVQGKRAEFAMLTEPVGEDGTYVAEYRALFRAVSDAIVVHKLFPGNRLPTKKERFDWSLGTGTNRLREISGADYALFFMSHDSYGTTGRKVAQVLAAGLLGVYVQPGIHIGYAGLVDLRSGDVVWFNADPAMGGDVRTPDGAQKRVEQLLAGFPTGSGPIGVDPRQ